MKNTAKKIIAMLMAVLMLAAVCPATVFAADGLEEEQYDVPGGVLPTTLIMGNYNLDAKTTTGDAEGKEAVNWKVLKVNEDGSIVAVMENVLPATQKMAATVNNPTFAFENSLVYANLNTTFFNAVFSADEKALLNTFGTDGYYVRLLTEAEMNDTAVFPNNGAKKAAVFNAPNTAKQYWTMTFETITNASGATNTRGKVITNTGAMSAQLLGTAQSVRPVVCFSDLPIVSFTQSIYITYKDVFGNAIPAGFMTDSFKFAIETSDIIEGSVLVVKMDGETITAGEDGFYTVPKNGNKDIAITVEGIEINDAEGSAVDQYNKAIAKYQAIENLDSYNAERVATLRNIVATDTSKFTRNSQYVDLAKTINAAIAAIPADRAAYNAIIAAFNGIPGKERFDLSAVETLIAVDINDQAVIGNQADLNAHVTAITQALEAVPANTTALIAARDAAQEKINSGDYSVSDSDVYYVALRAALRINDLLSASVLKQAEIEQKTQDIIDKTAALKRKAAPSYSVWLDAVSNAKALNPAHYTNYDAVQAAIDAEDYSNFTRPTDDPLGAPDIRYEDEVKAAAQAINDAVNALILKPADFTELDKTIAEAKLITLEKYYDGERYQHLQATIKDCEDYDRTGKTVQSDQPKVDELTAGLRSAIDDMELDRIPTRWETFVKWLDNTFGEAFRWMQALGVVLKMLFKGEIDIKELFDMLK